MTPIEYKELYPDAILLGDEYHTFFKKIRLGKKHTQETKNKMKASWTDDRKQEMVVVRSNTWTTEKRKKQREKSQVVWQKPGYREKIILTSTKKGTKQICKECGELKDYYHNGFCEECCPYKLPRRAKYKYIKLFRNPFPKGIRIVWHHINDILMVPIPEKIHRKAAYPDKNEHRKRTNTWLYYLYGLDFDRLLKKKIDQKVYKHIYYIGVKRK